jgi:peptidoglycan lytic transglycosylase
MRELPPGGRNRAINGHHYPRVGAGAPFQQQRETYGMKKKLVTICALAILGGGAAEAGQSGIASVYAYRGEKTANGEFVQPGHLTAAHRTLPFGTKVRVNNKRNGRSVVVRINDRGPFIRGRVIDLTPSGARALGFSGLAPVTLDVIGRS